MTISKHNFGRYVADQRRHVGLTQRELGNELHVTESAVSKWERGLSYPDISVVPALAKILRVSSDELINASDDLAQRQLSSDAQSYRTWRSVLIWIGILGYSIAILASVIVNLAVQHTLSWSWIVVAACAFAFSLTTLPLLPRVESGWTILWAAVGSLCVLLTTIWVSSGGGSWLVVAIASVLFATCAVFLPIFVATTTLPAGLRDNRAIVAAVVVTVALYALVVVVMLAIGEAANLLSPALLITTVALVPVWACLLTICYLDASPWLVAGAVVGISALTTLFLDSAIDAILGNSAPRQVNLGNWSSVYLGGNINLIVALGLFSIAAALCLVGVVKGLSRRGQTQS